jgi:FO synthase
VLHPVIPNIQVSWVKMGVDGAKACLQAGANDLGGTLMNESISRAAGASHGEMLSPEEMDKLIASLERKPAQRTTLYEPAPETQRRASYGGAPLAPVVQTPAMRMARNSEIATKRDSRAKRTVSSFPSVESRSVRLVPNAPGRNSPEPS